MTKQHEDLLTIFKAGLHAVSGQAVVRKELSTNDYKEFSHFIAIGKAAEAMLYGIPSEQIESGLLISKHGHISDNSYNNNKLICFESDHPLPKSASIKAGQLLIDYLKQLPKKASLLFLISGGTSALVEVLQDSWDLALLQELTNFLLANNYSINEINAVRQRISLIKGGGLWAYIAKYPVACLMISDVPNDDPAIIGSGLLFPPHKNQLPELPQHWIDKIGKSHQLLTATNFNWKIIASLEMAKKSSAIKAQNLGYEVKIIKEFLDGDSEQAAKSIVETLLFEQRNKQINALNTLFIWGGETTVKLPKNAGKGGRNQHLALAAAIEMDGLNNIYLLSAGTDGSDGMTSATGAMVDGFTVQRGKSKNLIAKDYLKRADSNSYFEATNELITTGVTGTNVMDLIIGISIK